MWRTSFGRSAVLAGIASLAASLAVAAPAARPATWADWVGDYRGALAWRNCTVAGARTATLALDATDGVIALELAPAGMALRAMTLVEEEGGWIAQDGDVSLRVTRPRAATIAVALELASGCTMRGTLRRTAARVAACDRLAGWARIEARCTKVTARLEDVAALARTRWKPGDAARCSERADRVELAMVDAGCAPLPDVTTAVPHACRSLVERTRALVACRPRSAAIVDHVMRLVRDAERAGAAAAAFEGRCQDAERKVLQIGAGLGCRL